MRILIAITASALTFFNLANAQPAPCLFCREQIVNNQSIFEGQFFNVLLDYAPRVRGHLLVIPKRHIVKVQELSKEEWDELYTVITKIAHFFSDCLHTDQYVILEKNGPCPFQEVPHIHFHFLPVNGHTWSEIFDSVPEHLTQDEIEEETKLFRPYF